MFVGRCVMRTAEYVVFTPCPPGPLAQNVSMRRSFSSTSISTSSSSLRPDVHRRERRVTPRRLVERRDANEAVDPRLGQEHPVGVLARHRHRRALEAGLVAGLIVENLTLEPAALGPLEVHAQQHVGPVLRLGAARARVNRDHGIGAVVLAPEQPLRFGRLHLRFQAREARLEVRGDVLAGAGPLHEHREIGFLLRKRFGQIDVVLQTPPPLQHALCLGLVLPEIGLADAGFELIDLVPGGAGVKDASEAPPSASRGRRAAGPDRRVRVPKKILLPYRFMLPRQGLPCRPLPAIHHASSVTSPQA